MPKHDDLCFCRVLAPDPADAHRFALGVPLPCQRDRVAPDAIAVLDANSDGIPDLALLASVQLCSDCVFVIGIAALMAAMRPDCMDARIQNSGGVRVSGSAADGACRRNILFAVILAASCDQDITESRVCNRAAYSSTCASVLLMDPSRLDLRFLQQRLRCLSTSILTAPR
jgi:hypothetical protein